MNNNNDKIQVHEDSDFILFLKDNAIQLTPEIRLVYEMSRFNTCFVCQHIDGYISKKNHYESYKDLKPHFMEAHTTDYEGNRRDRCSAYGLSEGSMHYDYSKTEVLAWNNNKILGLIDQMIVFENYLARRRCGRKTRDKVLAFHMSVGSCIVKIMKEFQIPQLILIKYLGVKSIMLEKYTTAYYMSLDDNDKPAWMKAFLKDK